MAAHFDMLPQEYKVSPCFFCVLALVHPDIFAVHATSPVPRVNASPGAAL